jgi:hypothetical protein
VGNFECTGFHCIPGCEFEGDCDPGYRCQEGQCIESCEAQDDCTIGSCTELGDGRRGKACALTNLPQCGDDTHCLGGLCIDGACRQWCDRNEYCSVGQFCDLVRGDHGYCAIDPDYEPPPPPENCAEAPLPDNWCARQHDNTYWCDQGAATCRPTYSAILIRDETVDCDPTAEPTAPGADVAGIRATEAGGAVAQLYLSVYMQGAGAENAHTNWEDVETRDGVTCDEQRWLSLGCGGWVLVIADGATPLASGWHVEVTEDAGICEEAKPDDAATVYLCSRFPSIEAPENDCTVRLGSTAVEERWAVP